MGFVKFITEAELPIQVESPISLYIPYKECLDMKRPFIHKAHILNGYIRNVRINTEQTMNTHNKIHTIQHTQYNDRNSSLRKVVHYWP